MFTMRNKFSFKEISIRCGRIILFIMLLLVSVIGVSYILTDKNCEHKYKEFFEESNDFDVLFFGSSHTEVFISPLELWNKYGFTSYNFGNPEEGLAVTYWVIKNAISINKPKIIVLDTYMFGFNDSYIGEETVHYGLDSFPINRTKLDAIDDLTDDYNEKIEMILKLGNYHYRWKNLDKSAFKNTEKFMKGNYSYGYWHTTQVKEFEQFPLTDNIADKNDCLFDAEYLNKIIKLCEAEDIALLLVTTPYICSEQQQSINNLIEVIASENNLPYVNMIKIDNLIDPKTDLYDEQHVNQSGMQKVTDYVGSYIVANYDIDNHKYDKDYHKWNEAFDDYMMLKYEWIMWQDDLDKVLMMLHDENIISYVYFNKNIESKDEPKIIRLLQNINKKNIYFNDRYNSMSEYTNILSKSDNMNEGYLLISNPGKTFDEMTGLTAKNALQDFIRGTVDDVSGYDAVVVLKDTYNDEIKLIQAFKYTDLGYRSDNIYSNVKCKYIYGVE